MIGLRSRVAGIASNSDWSTDSVLELCLQYIEDIEEADGLLEHLARIAGEEFEREESEDEGPPEEDELSEEDELPAQVNSRTPVYWSSVEDTVSPKPEWTEVTVRLLFCKSPPKYCGYWFRTEDDDLIGPYDTIALAGDAALLRASKL